MEGWIKLHRKLILWEWYDDANTFRLFIHLLLKANSEKGFWHGILINRGEIFTSINHLSNELKLSQKQIRNALKKLVLTNEILQKGANNGTMITVCKYEDYQSTTKAKGQTRGKRGANEGQTKGDKQEEEELKNKFIYNEFYDTQIELSKNDKYYILFVKWLFGENILKRPLEQVLTMQEQVSWKQFPAIIEFNDKYGVKVRDTLIELENWLMKNKNAKNSTVLGTLRTFAKNASNNKK